MNANVRSANAAINARTRANADVRLVPVVTVAVPPSNTPPLPLLTYTTSLVDRILGLYDH
jgi:hypothetical protein